MPHICVMYICMQENTQTHKIKNEYMFLKFIYKIIIAENVNIQVKIKEHLLKCR